MYDEFEIQHVTGELNITIQGYKIFKAIWHNIFCEGFHISP